MTPIFYQKLYSGSLDLKQCVNFLIKIVENYTKLYFCVISEVF